MRKNMFKIAVVAFIALALTASLIVAQPQGRGQGQGPGQGPGGQMGMRGGFDPAQMQQMMEQRMRENLGASEQEWKVLGPRVMKVQQLSRQVSTGGRGMFGFGGFGGRRGMQGPGGMGNRQGGDRPNRPDNAPERELSAVEKASEALMTTLENEAAKPEEIKSKLTALRAAREKAKQELATAQKELREIVTVRQEAQLVIMGMLD